MPLNRGDNNRRTLVGMSKRWARPLNGGYITMMMKMMMMMMMMINVFSAVNCFLHSPITGTNP